MKNIEKSIEFFTSIGFTFNNSHIAEGSACMLLGDKNVVVMLFTNAMFASFIGLPTAHIGTNETLISFSADSRAEVDELTKKAANAGASIFGEPAEIDGWMYGSGFADLDGHKWNILYMDMGAMGKK